MKKTLIVLLLLGAVIWSIGCKTKSDKEPASHKSNTLNYAGIYEYGAYGDSTQTGASGQIIIYAESTDTILFYLDVSIGAPSYNMGSIYDKCHIASDKTTFHRKFDYCNNSCEWSLNFSDTTVTIETINNAYDCGFGGNVIADGVYKKVSSEQPDHFEDMYGNKIYFAKTQPANYSK